MSLCIATAGKIIALTISGFSLNWIHSVEKTEWREDWSIVEKQLVLTSASVKGSGAGMDPGEGAVLKDGWWVWQPDLDPIASLALSASGATVSGWSLCPQDSDQPCMELGTVQGDVITLRYCE